MKVLMVLTSHDQLGDTGRKTGFWLEEMAAPYYVFKDAGAQVTLASPKGGQPPLDPKSNQPEFQTDIIRRFEGELCGIEFLCFSIRQSDINQANHLLYPSAQESIIASNANLVLALALIASVV